MGKQCFGNGEWRAYGVPNEHITYYYSASNSTLWILA